MTNTQQTTEQREADMVRLRAIAKLMDSMLASEPTQAEIDLQAKYPRMMRERVVRLIASEIVK